MEHSGGGNRPKDEANEVPRTKSQLSVHSIKSIVTRLCRRFGTPPTVNRVLANIYTQPLDAISVNPFVNLWKPSRLDLLRVWTIGVLMVIIRIVPMTFFVLVSCFLAKIFLGIIVLLNRHHINSEPFRQFARNLCFAILRVGLFFAGFYWIRVIDYRRDRNVFAPIIPVVPHSSFFDILIILKLKRPTFVSKAENQYAPLIGNVLRLCKGIYVNREDKNSRQKTINEIRDRANNGEQILIFPEGTCANRTALVQFKMGAFIPKLPLQPIIARWDAGDCMDAVTWSWEGPDAAKLFFCALTRVSTNLEITILPEYSPNNEEKANTRLFAENVSKLMCHDLGVLQSYYSFDDVPLMRVASCIRLFRSPACISFLKLCYKVLQKKMQLEEANKKMMQSKGAVKDAVSSSEQHPVGAVPSSLNPTPGGILGVGEADIDHAQAAAETYYARNFRLSGRLSAILEREKLVSHRWDKPTAGAPPAPFSTDGHPSGDEYQHLPISGVRRKRFSQEQASPPKGVLEKKQVRIYNAFCQFIEHCLTHLETRFEYRVIESSDDLISLLDLKGYARARGVDSLVGSLRLDTVLGDLIKIMEHSVKSAPVTTVHLLVILHLCDVREHSLWARLEAAVTLLDMAREATRTAQAENGALQLQPSASTASTSSKSGRSVSSDPETPLLNLDELRTLLWFSLGLQECNDQFFVNRHFDLKFLRTNLTRIFYRAVVENAAQLLE